MSNGEGREYNIQDLHMVQDLIEKVQHLIERSLVLYMTQKEVVEKLFNDAKIEPVFTEIVWQKLESENQEFFSAYNMMLALKDQILRFNELLEKQVELMNQMSQSETFAPPSNGSQTHSSIMLSHGGRMDFPPHMPMVQNSTKGIMQGYNGRTIKTDSVYAGNSTVMFGHNVLGETSISPFNGGESCSHSFNESTLNSFGVDQMTRNFSLSDLTADYSISTEILESYSRSFLGMETNFLDPHVTAAEDQYFRRLENTSETFNQEGLEKRTRLR